MKKKLLIVMLVLGMATLASATLVTIEIREADGVTVFDGRDIAPSTNLTIVVIGNALNPESGNLALLTTANGTISARGSTIDTPVTGNYKDSVVGSTWNDPTYNSDAGNLSNTIDWVAGSWVGYVWSANDTGGNPLVTGDWFIYDFHCDAEGDVDILWFQTGEHTGLEVAATITQIPEPMTIALLGLGGLFLRRRK